MEDFKVEISSIAQDRRPGVSGMLRVRNDAEFIDACVKSCIDALDELVIVYNDCSDESPVLIGKLVEEYKGKIRAFEFKPKIKAWNLDANTVDEILDKTISEENTLAGYYNFALAKTSCEYVMKVDADQIYIPSKLKEICDCYRERDASASLNIFKVVYIYMISLLLSISFRSKKYVRLLYIKNVYARYKKYLYEYIRKFKPDISMSGVNVIVDGNEVYVSLGRIINKGQNILPPFNGEGDHPIFKVTTSTCFVPIVDTSYNRLNNCGYSVIEKLIGLRKLWIVGPMWIHLNGCRRQNYPKSINNIKNYPDSFIRLSDFIKNNYRKMIDDIDESIFNKIKKIRYRFVYMGIDDEFLVYIYNNVHSFIRH